MTLEEIKKRIENGEDGEKAVALLSEYLKGKPDDDEALYIRGRKYWSLGDRANAINDYLAAIRINPYSKATMAIKTSYEILNYYNKDLYNP